MYSREENVFALWGQHVLLPVVESFCFHSREALLRKP